MILTADNRVLLQQRPKDWRTYPGYISTFGGKVEIDETPTQAIIREIQEELGANISENDITPLGSYTETITKHNELVHGYFWRDKHNLISGCYEGEPVYFDTLEQLLALPLVMDDVIYLLYQCRNK